MYLKGVNDFSTRKGERFSQKVMTETNRGRANEDVPENVVMIVSEETPILLNIRACKSLYYSHTSSHTRVDVLGARMGLEKIYVILLQPFFLQSSLPSLVNFSLRNTLPGTKDCKGNKRSGISGLD